MNLAQQDQYQKEVIGLRDRVEYLEAENKQLKTVVYGDKPVVRVSLPGVDLTEMEENILYCLSRQEFTSHEMLWQFLYGRRDPEDWPKAKIMDIWFTRVRSKTAALGITIETIRGRGHKMPKESRDIVAHYSVRYDGGADA